MKSLPVHWYQGQFLRPHHFQAADRYWSELIRTSERCVHPFGYGLYCFGYNEDLLRQGDGILEVDVLQARMPDGTLFIHQSGSPLKLENLREELQKRSPRKVLLCIPQLQLGSVNVVGDPPEAEREQSEVSRYVWVEQEVADESGGQSKEHPIRFRKLKGRLRIEGEEGQRPEGFDCLPIARVKLEDGDPVLDDRYIPPLAVMDAWIPKRNKSGTRSLPPRSMVTELTEALCGKMDELAEAVGHFPKGRYGRNYADSARVAALDHLNDIFAGLDAIAPKQRQWQFLRGIPPLVAYQEIVRHLGHMAIFTDERKAAGVPPYDHENLYEVFDEVTQKLVTIIRNLAFDEPLQLNYRRSGDQLCVTLPEEVPEWFDPSWDWYVGVNHARMTSEEFVNAWDRFWVHGCQRKVEDCFQGRSEGLRLERERHRSLPNENWTYYHVIKSGPVWEENKRSIVQDRIAMQIEGLPDPARDGRFPLANQSTERTLSPLCPFCCACLI